MVGEAGRALDGSSRWRALEGETEGPADGLWWVKLCEGEDSADGLWRVKLFSGEANGETLCSGTGPNDRCSEKLLRVKVPRCGVEWPLAGGGARGGQGEIAGDCRGDGTVDEFCRTLDRNGRGRKLEGEGDELPSERRSVARMPNGESTAVCTVFVVIPAAASTVFSGTRAVTVAAVNPAPASTACPDATRSDGGGSDAAGSDAAGLDLGFLYEARRRKPSENKTGRASASSVSSSVWSSSQRHSSSLSASPSLAAASRSSASAFRRRSSGRSACHSQKCSFSPSVVEKDWEGRPGTSTWHVQIPRGEGRCCTLSGCR